MGFILLDAGGPLLGYPCCIAGLTRNWGAHDVILSDDIVVFLSLRVEMKCRESEANVQSLQRQITDLTHRLEQSHHTMDEYFIFHIAIIVFIAVMIKVVKEIDSK